MMEPALFYLQPMIVLPRPVIFGVCGRIQWGKDCLRVMLMYEKLLRRLCLHAIHFQTLYESKLHDRVAFWLLFRLPVPKRRRL